MKIFFIGKNEIVTIRSEVVDVNENLIDEEIKKNRDADRQPNHINCMIKTLAVFYI